MRAVCLAGETKDDEQDQQQEVISEEELMQSLIERSVAPRTAGVFRDQEPYSSDGALLHSPRYISCLI